MSDAIERSARVRLAEEGIEVTSWGNRPGDRYAPHAHAFDKVLVVVDGSITFRLTETGGAYELSEGDRLDLPSSTMHAADVGAAGVRCLEGHLPAGPLRREPRRMADWVTGPR